MAISTSSQNLVDFYNQKIKLDTEQLGHLKVVADDGYSTKIGKGTTQVVKIWSTKEILESMNNIIEPLDSDVVSINNEIKTLQSLVLSTAQEAISVGCGTGTASPGFTTVTVYHDIVKYEGYDFSGSNPFNPVDGNINNSNVGLGTYNYVTQVAIGTYYDPINTCNIETILFLTCNNTVCQNYADTIIDLNAEIVTLQNRRDNRNANINILKEERIKYELQDYAYRRSKQNLKDSIDSSKSIINFLQQY
jgi:hypothetical protein